jgi:hypothetical protein
LLKLYFAEKATFLAAFSKNSLLLPRPLGSYDVRGANVPVIVRGVIAGAAFEVAGEPGSLDGAAVQRERAHVFEMCHAVAAFFRH